MDVKIHDRDLGVVGITLTAIGLLVAEPFYGGLGLLAVAITVAVLRIRKARRRILFEFMRNYTKD